MSRVFANGPGDRGSIPGQTKDSKTVRDAALLNTQHYKVRDQENGVMPSLHLGVVAIEKGTFL